MNEVNSTLDSLVGTDFCFVAWDDTGHIVRAGSNGARKRTLCGVEAPESLATLVMRRWFGDVCEKCVTKYREQNKEKQNE